jgi:hypothetical protein
LQINYSVVYTDKIKIQSKLNFAMRLAEDCSIAYLAGGGGDNNLFSL